MNFIQRLMPREGRFFSLFDAHAKLVVDGALALADVLRNYDVQKDREAGIKIIEDGDALVHVSGHPRRSELRRMYEWVRPQIGVPVHGEAAHLVAQGSLMSTSGIGQVAQVRDGDMLRLAPGPATIIDQVPFGRIYKDGRLIGTDQAMGIRDRRKLSFAGHVAVNVVLDDKYELAGDPEVLGEEVAERAAGDPVAARQVAAVEAAVRDEVEMPALEEVPLLHAARFVVLPELARDRLIEARRQRRVRRFRRRRLCARDAAEDSSQHDSPERAQH